MKGFEVPKNQWVEDTIIKIVSNAKGSNSNDIRGIDCNSCKTSKGWRIF